jgi:DNA-nicking Smr family endonuclease
MSRRRSLSEDERALWDGFTRAIKPLRPRLAPKPTGDAPTPLPAKPPPPGPDITATPAKPAPPLMPLGRRLKQRVARGREAIDARIDLHGLTLAQAHLVLLRFLRQAQADGAKIALVVTGKGARDGPGERGALRREVPMWLRLPEFRACVLGFEDAHIGHGGEGALYVRLRRRR